MSAADDIASRLFNGTDIEMLCVDGEWRKIHVRLKPAEPEKKPDVVLYVGLERRTGASAYVSDDRVVVNHWSHQLRLTFSGDTGKLIKAEVL